jgi:anti-sigma factor RsiW
MTGEHLSKEKLQRHYDGDLSGPEAADAQQHLLSCAQCEAELARFERLGDMLRWSTDDATAAADVDFSQMFTHIERAVQDERRSSVPDNVVSLQSKRSRLLQRAAPTLGALAIAAVALLMVNRSDPPKEDAQVAMLDTSTHSEITGVKFGKNAGQVFRVQVADDESVPVVWIDDDDEDDDEGESQED